MNFKRFRARPWLLLVTLLMVIPASAKWKEKVLYSFQGGADGQYPAGGVVFDKTGNLYGATQQGGNDNCSPMAACGTVYQVSPQADGSWTETVLYVFKGKAANDGEYPEGGVIADGSGNIYGTTGYGGTGGCVLLGIPGGCGTVYEMSPPKTKGGAWTYTILHSFQGGKDGYVPHGDLVFDSAGNLYGATLFGGGKGTTCNSVFQFCGTVFKLKPPKKTGGKWTEKVLHSFAGMSSGHQNGDGANPNGGLVLDSKGNVYGTTYIGGYNCPHNSGQGCGTAFEISPPTQKAGVWTEKVLHRFNPANSYEAWPMAGLIIDKNGRLFGTTHEDTVFRLLPNSKRPGSWSETILYSFKGKGASYALDAPLVFDATGNLNTTAYGGSGGSVDGNVFKLRPPTRKGKSWTIDVLYSFGGSPDGAWPAAGLIFDKSGRLYGTTQAGGGGQSCQNGCGTVFEILH